MPRKLLRFASTAALGKALSDRDKRWLGIGLALAALRILDSRAKKRAARHS
ncbi:MAG: hypothetical protein WA580_06670 [Acidimicrobiales bacterium]|jgi:hypothetical protein